MKVTTLLVGGALVLGGAASAAAQVVVSDKFGSSHVAGFTDPTRQALYAGKAKEAGVGWAKEAFAWHNMETAPGVYSFINQDRFIDADVAAGLQIMVEIYGTPPFYSMNPPNVLYPTNTAAGRNAWANFLTATVNRYKNRVKVWQIWSNVDDPPFWPLYPGGVTEYRLILERAYTTIKAADPTATVVTASTDPRFLNLMLDQNPTPNYFDAIAVHNYAEPYAPEVSTLTALRLDAVRDVSQRRAGGKPLVVSEYGWPSAPAAPTGVTEQLQAFYLNRSSLLQGVFPDVQRMFWTDFKDQPVGGSYEPNAPEDNFGMLLRFDESHKISFNAHKAMGTALAGAQLIGQRHPAKAGFTLIEGFETGRTYTAFSAGGAAHFTAVTTAVSHRGAASMQINYDMPNPPPPNSGVVLAPNPTFFLPVPGTPRRVRMWARGNGGPAPMLTVAFRDANGEDFSAILGLVSGTQWKEYTYDLDAAFGTSSLIQGNQDDVIQYPIQFGGFAVNIWTAATPVDVGVLWVDDITFEYGPTVIDYEFRRPGEVVHALWALDGSYSVRIPTLASVVKYRDYTNTVFDFFPSGGGVTVPVGLAPAMVTIPAPGPVFTDVPQSSPSWGYVEGLFRSGVTSGCSLAPPMYCPSATVNRAQMAKFLIVAKYGAAYVPPPAAGYLVDVPPSDPFAPYIEKLLLDGVTQGCAPSRYCPDNPVTREQMAVFLVRSNHGGGYNPPPATGIFADVPTSHPFAPFIEKLYQEGVTGGCATGPLRYCPTSPVARDQMAAFLTRAFAIPVP